MKEGQSSFSVAYDASPSEASSSSISSITPPPSRRHPQQFPGAHPASSHVMIATPIKMTKASTVRRPHDASINARSALPADDEAPCQMAAASMTGARRCSGSRFREG